MSEPVPALRRTAFLLTLAGALPFIGLVIAMAVLDPPTNATAGLWLQTYAAVILSFLGGARWGMAVTTASGTAAATLGVSVLVALGGWVILPPAIILMPGPVWYLVYAVLFALQFGWDWTSSTVPAWFKPARLGASILVIASLTAAWAIHAYGL